MTVGTRVRGVDGAVGAHLLRARGGRQRGGAVQVESMIFVLTPAGPKCLKLNHDKPLSNFGFKFNLRHYSVVVVASTPRSKTIAGRVLA